MPEFYPPYQFVKATGVINNKEARENFEVIKSGNSENFDYVRHDIYTKNANTGRIICKITTLSPTVVGSIHNGCNNSSMVNQYKLNGKPAIPANTIKGLISSIAEALSQSTLRVLNKNEYQDKTVRTTELEHTDKGKKLKKSYFEYFDTINKDLKPFDNNRENLTIAEMLFGFVEEVEKNTKDKDKQGNALGGRVSFYDAQSNGNIELLEEIKLKILDLPKLPCPSFYYYSDSKNHLSIDNFYEDSINKTTNDIKPRGRKFYIPHKNNDVLNKAKSGNEEHDNQKSFCQPIGINKVLYFHIDFENISDAELSLLLTCLEPSENFTHKIGYAKPLGLGSIKINIESLLITDITKRYSLKEINNSRYHKGFLSEEGALPQNYQYENSEFESVCRKDFVENKDFIDKQALKEMKIIGEFDQQDVQILYPVTSEQLREGEESEGFKWFVQNKGCQTTPQNLPFIVRNIPAMFASCQTIIPPTQNQQNLNLANMDSRASTWLKNKIAVKNNSDNFNDLNDKQIEDILKGKALSRAYCGMPEGNKKTEVLELIKQEIHERGILNYVNYTAIKHYGI